ncbi:hypothetical protein BJ978_000328 [Agromyces terreus]|uniref:FAD-dependent oxidoreductase n=1 Tax=Agromyces terreus TaxID=424795 RepID=A0A9X2GVY0_9MICO|nr:FAD-dependent oxidoreductase [Agromyces terreus]MCP2369652.1 hypothetical protein [Agromyces terreus]
MNQHATEILIVGGGVGGVAAALSALQQGSRVFLTEETDWLGGQLSSQMVPPDEHTWIERFGASRNYRAFRAEVREFYRRWYPLKAESSANDALNPGAGGVSALCHEPRVSALVLAGMLSPWIAAGRLVIRMEAEPVGVDLVDRDRIGAVSFRGSHGELFTVEGDIVLDATETGALLPLAGVEYVTGAESQTETGEPHAPDVADPLNMQAASVCFAVSHHEGEDHRIDRPADYDEWMAIQPDFWHGPQFGWTAPHPHTLAPRTYEFLPNPADRPWSFTADQSKDNGADELWRFRRIIARNHFLDGTFDSDITVVNWPMIDYLGGPLFDTEDAAEHATAARRQSLNFLYWLQHDAPRLDGGTGWRGLRIRPDVSGTDDGFAKRPYYRESRRIKAEYQITELDLAVDVRGEQRAVQYEDSVGVGAYRIDLHPSTGGDNYIDVPAWPFEIPLRALVPQRVRNLIAAGKNIGTTHITNGCYRLHPVEWGIGEAAGVLASYSLANRTEPQAVTSSIERIEDLQRRLTSSGVELRWPDVRYY